MQLYFPDSFPVLIRIQVHKMLAWCLWTMNSKLKVCNLCAQVALFKTIKGLGNITWQIILRGHRPTEGYSIWMYMGGGGGGTLTY